METVKEKGKVESVGKRTPLQPKKQENGVFSSNVNGNQAISWVATSVIDANKENSFCSDLLQTQKAKAWESLCEVTSLREELKAVRKKMQRLKVEEERTERLLKERNRRLELEMNDMMERCEFQKILELEVDRLYRLKQLHSQSTRISPMRSLREKARERRNIGEILTFDEDDDEVTGSQHTECDANSCLISEAGSPSSSSASNSPEHSQFCLVPFV